MTSKKQSFLAKHPRLSYLLVGFLMGLVVAGSLWYGTAGTADILEAQVQKLEMTLVEEQLAHEELKTAHKQLKASFKEDFEEITKPDGSKITRRITRNDVDSSEKNTSQSTTVTNHTAARTAGETSTTRSTTKDLDLRLDIGTDLSVGFGGYYRFMPPFSFGLGIEVDPKNPSVIKELRLGIGVRF